MGVKSVWIYGGQWIAGVDCVAKQQDGLNSSPMPRGRW